MKKPILIKYLIPCLIMLVLFSVIGCLERKEEIVVDTSGNTTIDIELNGKAADFEMSASYPTEQYWTILESKIFTDKNNEEKQKIKAVQKIPFGKPFQETFTNDEQSEFSLHFPTKVEKWKEGSRTYYKFSRTYKARTFIHYNFGSMLDENKELEEKILEAGIFNVPEADRNQYIENLRMQMLYYNYTIFDDAVGLLIKDYKYPLSVKTEVGTLMRTYLEEAISNEKILEILQLDEEAIDIEYNKLNNLIEKELLDFVSQVTQQDQTVKDAPFQKTLAVVKTDYRITEALSSDKFSIALQLPGTIISSNGLTDPEEPGVVYWEFSGDALHDRDIPLTAISAVE